MWRTRRLAGFFGLASATAGIWLVLMATVWWPFMLWTTEQLRRAHAAGSMVNAPESIIIVPVILIPVAGALASGLMRRDWWLLRVLLELAGAAILMLAASACVSLIYVGLGGDVAGALALLALLMPLEIFLVIRMVVWLEQKRARAAPGLPFNPGEGPGSEVSPAG